LDATPSPPTAWLEGDRVVVSLGEFDGVDTACAMSRADAEAPHRSLSEALGLSGPEVERQRERAFLQADIAAIESLLADMPASRVLERIDFEGRLLKQRAKLAAMDAEKPR
jgi:hypothetical protein